MPIYEYHCEECGVTFDKLVRSMFGAVEVVCPECHSTKCKKNISRFGTVLGSSSGSTSASSCAPTGG